MGAVPGGTRSVPPPGATVPPIDVPARVAGGPVQTVSDRGPSLSGPGDSGARRLAGPLPGPVSLEETVVPGRLGGWSVLGVRQRGGSGGPGARRPADRDLLPARLVGRPRWLPCRAGRGACLRAQPIVLRCGPGHRLAGNCNDVHVSDSHLHV